MLFTSDAEILVQDDVYHDHAELYDERLGFCQEVLEDVEV